MNAMRFEHGLIQDEAEFMEQAPFDELEHQYRLLGKLFKQEWKKVKKNLRSRLIWNLFKKDKGNEKQEINGEIALSAEENLTAETGVAEQTADITTETVTEHAAESNQKTADGNFDEGISEEETAFMEDVEDVTDTTQKE